jgi:peptidylprolyl isomerase
MKENKMNIVISVVIFLAVVAFLVFITINKKGEPAAIQTAGTEQGNMQTQQIEGVKITVLKEGTGVAAKSGDTVAMNYTGKLMNGTVFDSNVDPKFQHVEPFVFTIGAGQVIKGWDVGVAGMKVGEKRTLEINPDYGYGASGAGGVIPPNATLSFDVELLQIK